MSLIEGVTESPVMEPSPIMEAAQPPSSSCCVSIVVLGPEEQVMAATTESSLRASDEHPLCYNDTRGTTVTMAVQLSLSHSSNLTSYWPRGAVTEQVPIRLQGTVGYQAYSTQVLRHISAGRTDKRVKITAKLVPIQTRNLLDVVQLKWAWEARYSDSLSVAAGEQIPPMHLQAHLKKITDKQVHNPTEGRKRGFPGRSAFRFLLELQCDEGRKELHIQDVAFAPQCRKTWALRCKAAKRVESASSTLSEMSTLVQEGQVAALGAPVAAPVAAPTSLSKGAPVLAVQATTPRDRLRRAAVELQLKMAQAQEALDLVLEVLDQEGLADQPQVGATVAAGPAG
jgi:hypothetical protein